jgi:hypothetical protein
MMRNLLMMVALTACTAASATEMNDTIVFSNPRRVTVMTNDSVQRVKVSGKDGDERFRYESTVAIDKTKTTTKIVKKVAGEDDKWLFDLGVGVAIPTNTPDGHGFATFRSWEFLLGFRYGYTPKGALQTYSTGLWLNWRSYGVPEKNMMSKNADDIVVFGEYPANYSNTSSHISIFSLSVPFLFTQRFGKHSKASFSLGPVVNVNLLGRINNEWKDGDDFYEVGTKNIGYHPVTVDFMGILKYGGWGLYCKYSPMSVLKKKSENGLENPQFHSLTVGLFF